ncbi:hypothetical protein AB0M94_10375 [Streptomyces xanthochromogenes]|uniref:Uncharacterized protein n=1 Tax=Streptomyces xanthochromogenes TaxID=67384 RepID=A0ABQ3AC98_9ACTN|nr:MULTISPECIES: hypothetical protein [Streptomyces]MYV90742.1 hypothetical protein [Streptomyces sp. SID1034]GGY45764.1 hypothetical protein GCM10010326_44840 [Streptomyces xanthochromogenes]
MTTKPRLRESLTAARRPISITAVVDCVGALASHSVHGHLYLYDTNKAGGSTGFGTEELRTKVRRGDQLLWNVLALECEAFVSIDDIVIDRAVVEPERRTYPGTDVAYWIGTVKRDDILEAPYRIKFRVGTRTEPITTTLSPALFG